MSDESAFWQDLRDDLADPEFRKEFEAESRRLTADDVRQLLERIDALQTLLVCYRVGPRPSESLFNKLERTKANEERIRRQFDGTGASQ